MNLLTESLRRTFAAAFLTTAATALATKLVDVIADRWLAGDAISETPSDEPLQAPDEPRASARAPREDR